MQKLLLASNGKFLIEQGYKLLGLPLNQINIGWVTTASKGVPNKTYLGTHAQQMRAQMLTFDEFDIEGKAPDELRAFLKSHNVIHVEGGNTFYLLRAIKQTGFDNLLKEAIANGLIYVGTSAGAYVACPDISVAVAFSEKDNCGLSDFAALNLVPFLLRVHHLDTMLEETKKFATTATHPLRLLRDGQGILVDGSSYKFVGDGKEVTL